MNAIGTSMCCTSAPLASTMRVVGSGAPGPSEVGLQLQWCAGAEVEPTGPVAPCPLSASAAFGRIPALAVLEVHRRLWVGRGQVRTNQSDRGSVNRTEVVVRTGWERSRGRPSRQPSTRAVTCMSH